MPEVDPSLNATYKTREEGGLYDEVYLIAYKAFMEKDIETLHGMLPVKSNFNDTAIVTALVYAYIKKCESLKQEPDIPYKRVTQEDVFYKRRNSLIEQGSVLRGPGRYTAGPVRAPEELRMYNRIRAQRRLSR